VRKNGASLLMIVKLRQTVSLRESVNYVLSPTETKLPPPTYEVRIIPLPGQSTFRKRVFVGSEPHEQIQRTAFGVSIATQISGSLVRPNFGKLVDNFALLAGWLSIVTCLFECLWWNLPGLDSSYSARAYNDGANIRDIIMETEGEATDDELEEVLFEAEDRVIVKTAFVSDSTSEQLLKQGLLGTVIRIDSDGDAEVAFDDLDNSEWVMRANFDKLLKQMLGRLKADVALEPEDDDESLAEFEASGSVIGGADIESEPEGFARFGSARSGDFSRFGSADFATPETSPLHANGRHQFDDEPEVTASASAAEPMSPRRRRSKNKVKRAQQDQSEQPIRRHQSFSSCNSFLSVVHD